MAKPGLEPGRPRFSVVRSKRSNSGEFPANKAVYVRRRSGRMFANSILLPPIREMEGASSPNPTPRPERCEPTLGRGPGLGAERARPAFAPGASANRPCGTRSATAHRRTLGPHRRRHGPYRRHELGWRARQRRSWPSCSSWRRPAEAGPRSVTSSSRQGSPWTTGRTAASGESSYRSRGVLTRQASSLNSCSTRRIGREEEEARWRWDVWLRAVVLSYPPRWPDAGGHVVGRA
jgi:hypothetical protein